MKIYGLCGVLAPIVAFACIGLAVFYSPWFDWTENWLSDLGGMVGEEPIWAARGISSILFNIGIIIAGILGIILGIGMKKTPLSKLLIGRLGLLLYFIDVCALCAVGLFPETTGYLHSLASAVFFLLIPWSLLLIGVTVRSFDKSLGFLIMMLGFIPVLAFPLLFVPRPWGSNAISEMIPSLSLGIFSVVFGIKLLKTDLMNATQ